MLECEKSIEHKEFSATAHVTQDWILNEKGEFIRATNECVEVTHKPDSDDVITCAVCGSEAIWK